jgi:predicted nucleotidyltransferase
MPLDQSKIGQLVTEQMEAIEHEYGDDVREVEIGAIITIVQVLARDGEEVASDVRLRHNIGDPYLVLGMLRAAEQVALRGS